MITDNYHTVFQYERLLSIATTIGPELLSHHRVWALQIQGSAYVRARDCSIDNIWPGAVLRTSQGAATYHSKAGLVKEVSEFLSGPVCGVIGTTDHLPIYSCYLSMQGEPTSAISGQLYRDSPMFFFPIIVIEESDLVHRLTLFSITPESST
jgi:hypothetical protein